MMGVFDPSIRSRVEAILGQIPHPSQWGWYLEQYTDRCIRLTLCEDLQSQMGNAFSKIVWFIS